MTLRNDLPGFYFHLMTDEVPVAPLEGHPPYVHPDEAIQAAEKEAQTRKVPVQIYRVADGRVDSQPWRVVQPSRGMNQ
jgi:hypothetical protein